jgi:ATP-dependent protease ClpP protease subunit
MKTWYRLRATRKTAELRLYDEIGAWGVNSKTLLADLDALGAIDTLTVRINSPGGDVFDALAIHNALHRHAARVTVCIDALCASAATLVALAGDEVRMADNALFMIHEPWTVAQGNSADLLKQSDLLDTVAEQIVTIYARKTGWPADEIRELMREETWYTAEQALSIGFIDAIDEPLRLAALIHHHPLYLSHRKDLAMSDPVIPETLDTPIPEPTPEPTPVVPPPTPEPPAAEPLAILRACTAVNEPKLAEALLASGPYTEAQVKARVAQAAVVRAVCAIARVPELADALIAAGADENAAKVATWNALAERSAAHPIDAAPPLPTRTVVTRAQFDAMTPADRAAALKAGLRITD